MDTAYTAYVGTLLPIALPTVVADPVGCNEFTFTHQETVLDLVDYTSYAFMSVGATSIDVSSTSVTEALSYSVQTTMRLENISKATLTDMAFSYDLTIVCSVSALNVNTPISPSVAAYTIYSSALTITMPTFVQ